MAIKLNNTSISPGFQGIIPLGQLKKLYVNSQDSDTYQLYGTLFKKQKKATVTPPSGTTTFEAASNLEIPLHKRITQRKAITAELQRLTDSKELVLAGYYDYGVSQELTEILEFLTTNTVKPLPSVVVGGDLAYDKLLKSNEGIEGFEDDWESWSHVRPGREKNISE